MEGKEKKTTKQRVEEADAGLHGLGPIVEEVGLLRKEQKATYRLACLVIVLAIIEIVFLLQGELPLLGLWIRSFFK